MSISPTETANGLRTGCVVFLNPVRVKRRSRTSHKQRTPRFQPRNSAPTMRVTFIPEEMPDEMKSLTLILALGQVRGATPEENVEQVSAVIDGESVIRSFINLTVLSPEHFAQDARLACAMLFDIGGAGANKATVKGEPCIGMPLSATDRSSVRCLLSPRSR